MQPRILVDARFAETADGGSRYRLELATNLVRVSAARYTFLAYRAGAARLGVGQTADIPVVTTKVEPGTHPAGDIFEHVRLPRMARRLATDIYHGTFQVLPFVAAAPLSVLTIHDMAVFAYPGGYGSRFVRFMRFVLPQSIRRARAIIAVSDATKAEIVRLMPEVESKIVTILNGVSTAFVDACAIRPEAVSAVRQKLALPPRYVLYVGNLEPKKNLPRLLDGFSRLKAASDLPHKLVITGKQMASGPGSGIAMSEEQLRSLAHFTGYVDESDLPALYRGADVVAYPSLYEGFGMPVLEGLAAGVPVVTSNVSSLPEVAGGAALTVDPLDPEAIAQGLAQALTDQAWRTVAIRRGLARASELTWQANARRTAALYQELWTRSLMGRLHGH